MSADLRRQIEEKQNLKTKADQHEIDFNKRYLDNINTVRNHLQEEIKTKEAAVIPKHGGKKIIPHPASNATGVVPGRDLTGPERLIDDSSSPSRLLNF